MKRKTEEYYNLIEHIGDNFTEIDSDIMVDLRKTDITYLSPCQRCDEMERAYPFLLEVTEGEGTVSLTEEEHKILVKYFQMILKKEDMERRRIYFQRIQMGMFI